MRRLLIRSGVAVAALAGVSSLILLSVQTRPGKDALASFLSRQLSSADQKIAIGRIEGFVPFDMRIDHITAADSQGIFAEIDNAALRWSPSALLALTVHIDALTADRIHLARFPASQPTPASDKPFSLPSLPPLRLDRLAIAIIDLDAVVLGQAASLSLEGSASLANAAQGLQLQLDRKDVPGRFAANLHFVPGTEALDLDVNASEPAGGLIGTLLDLRDEPALALAIQGKGTLKNWDSTLVLTADTVERLKGSAQLRGTAEGIRSTFTLDGDLGPLLQENIAPLVAGSSKLTGALTIKDKKTLALESVLLDLAAIKAETHGILDLAQDQSDLAFTFKGAGAKQFGALAQGLSWSGLQLAGTARGSLAKPLLETQATIHDPAASGYGAQAITIAAHTQAKGTDPLALRIDAAATGLRADSAKIAQSIGKEAHFSADGLISENHQVTWTAARLDFLPLEALFKGKIGGGAFNGTMQMTRLDLAAFGPLVGRPVSGTMQLAAQFDGAPDLSRVDINLSGKMQDIKMDIPAVDRPFKAATFKGFLSRAQDGTLSVQKFKLDAQGLTLDANGAVDHQTSDLKLNLALADLSLLDSRLAGKGAIAAAITGGLNAPGLDLSLQVPQGQAMGQKIEDLRLTVESADLIGHPQGHLALSGTIGGKPAKGGGQILARPDGSYALDGLDLAIGSATLAGQGTRAADGALAGQVRIKASDLGDLSPFALTTLGGSLDADIAASMQDGKPIFEGKGTASNLRYDTHKLASATVDLRVTDPQNLLLLDGKADLSGLESQGTRLETLRLNATSSKQSSDLALAAEGFGGKLAANGSLTASTEQKAVTLKSLRLSRSDVTATLNGPSQFLWRNGVLSVDRLVLAANRGLLTLRGRVDDTLDLDVTAKDLPLALAKAASPDLDLHGTLNGTVTLTGPTAAPSGRYAVSVNQFTMPQMMQSGLRPLDARASGQLDGKRMSLDARIIGLDTAPTLINGSVPIGAGELALKVRGGLALEQVNALLATSGMRVTGQATFDADVKGTTSQPLIYGTMRLANGTFEDVINGVKLDPINVTATAAGREVKITSFTAKTASGGSLQGQGQVLVDPGANFPGTLNFAMTNAVLISSDLMHFVANGKLGLTGALAQRPKIAGHIDVKALDINIQEQLPGGSAELLHVRHVNVPSDHPIAKRQAAAAKQKQKRANKQPFIADLDLTIAAPNNVFVRGMGMTAELNGNLRIHGTSAAPVTEGAFDLQRGQFDVLGRRLTFTEGHIAFNGSTDPDLNFTTETSSTDITAKILVTGTASEPKVSFSSTPDLPQDEILARLLFGRSTGSLTASQAIQVAQTVAQFSGGGSSALNSLRKSLGLDNLDIGTSSSGGTQFGLGKRLNDRIYLGVTQGTTPSSSRATVDIDITRNLKVQGSTGMNGDAELGVGGQWDYR